MAYTHPNPIPHAIISRFKQHRHLIPISCNAAVVRIARPVPSNYLSDRSEILSTPTPSTLGDLRERKPLPVHGFPASFSLISGENSVRYQKTVFRMIGLLFFRKVEGGKRRGVLPDKESVSSYKTAITLN